MLQTQTVEPGTLSLLKELMALQELKNFSLVGGTALSLKYGHRISVDLDLFSSSSFSNDGIQNVLKNKFGSSFLTEERPSPFGIFCFLEQVKVDIVRHPHTMIGEIETFDGIRFFSDRDIMAMKIQALLGRAKKKDFWDIAELLNHYSVADFVKAHKEKYNTQNLLISVPQIMTYFSDAEEDENPRSLKGQTWPKIQKTIQKKVAEYLS